MGFLTIAVVLLLTSFAESDKCRILAFEGGGSRGAYQAGVVHTLAHSLPASSVSWNVISGISTGSLNTCGCIQYPVGQEAPMSDFLIDTWLSLNGSASAYVEWTYGLVEGLLFKSSLYDTSPLREFLDEHWKSGVKRNFTIATTDFNHGTLKVFDERTAEELVPEVVMCSAAPPFYFPPQHFEDSIYVDGGCLVNLDLASPINKCLDFGYAEEDIVVDMIFLTSTHLEKPPRHWSVRSVHKRIQEIKAYDSLMWFGFYARQAFPWVDFRYAFVPSEEMPGGEIPLDFSKENIRNEIELGKKDAKRVIESGENGLDTLGGGMRGSVKAYSRRETDSNGTDS